MHEQSYRDLDNASRRRFVAWARAELDELERVADCSTPHSVALASLIDRVEDYLDCDDDERDDELDRCVPR